eukprot:m.98769 g.98769  ORF g.98769 m.98769 type:complete len:121 (+) comp14880_c2_seq6:2691-3053(+)
MNKSESSQVTKSLAQRHNTIHATRMASRFVFCGTATVAAVPSACHLFNIGCSQKACDGQQTSSAQGAEVQFRWLIGESCQAEIRIDLLVSSHCLQNKLHVEDWVTPWVYIQNRIKFVSRI